MLDLVAYEGLRVLNYELGKKLGEGGFGAVYLAEHTEIGRKVAIKILHPEFARHESVVARFFREARAVCAIGHRAIIEVYNFGRLDDGVPYYLMEYFPGRSLDERIADDGPVPLSLVPTLFDPVVSALEAAHDKGIVHRDLKPDNIMLRERDGAIEEIKLLDFGIAKLLGDGDPSQSRTGFAMGTPLYMAPEQARDAKSVDARADVYSFGATVYSAIAGKPPFAADSYPELLLQVMTEPPPPLRRTNPSIPAALDHAVAQCLAKRREDRPDTIGDAWQRLRDGLAGRGVGPLAETVPPPELATHTPPARTTPAPATAAPTPGEFEPRPPAINRGVVVGLFVAWIIFINVAMLVTRNTSATLVSGLAVGVVGFALFSRWKKGRYQRWKGSR